MIVIKISFESNDLNDESNVIKFYWKKMQSNIVNSYLLSKEIAQRYLSELIWKLIRISDIAVRVAFSGLKCITKFTFWSSDPICLLHCYSFIESNQTHGKCSKHTNWNIHYTPDHRIWHRWIWCYCLIQCKQNGVFKETKNQPFFCLLLMWFRIFTPLTLLLASS